eukprot:g4909.t1
MGLPLLKLLLATIDVAVLCLVVALLVSNCRSKQYGVRVWSKAFHVLVFFWLILRGVFWVLAITTRQEWHSISFGLLYWLPNPLQFGSFLLLPMAYSKVLSPSNQWEARSRTVGRAYVTLVSSMLVYMVGFAVAQAVSDNRQLRCVTAGKGSEHTPQACYDMELNSQAFRVLTGFCFFALAAGVAGYGFQMSKLTTSQNRAQLIYQPRALAALNCFLVAVFLSKGAYQMSSVLRLWYLPDIPLQGSEDVCLLNFCVFLFWDYVPTVWLLLVMEGTTGEHVGTSVVKAVFPSRILSNFGDDMSNLPDYGVFREIKAAAARQAARSDRAGSRASSNGMQYSYSSSNGMGISPRVISSNDLKNWLGNQGGGGSYPVSHNSRENLSQGGGGSSNGYGFYGSVTTAAAASSVGSSLGGLAFVSSPSTPSDLLDRRPSDLLDRRPLPRGGSGDSGGGSGGGGGGVFSWLLGWRKGAGAGGEQAGVRGDRERSFGGRSSGGRSAAPPSLWQRIDHGQNNDYSSSTRAPTALHESSSRSLDNGDHDRGENGGGWGGVVAAVSRWWRGAFDGTAGGAREAGALMAGAGGGGAAGETSSLWKTHGSGIRGGCMPHRSYGELSRAAEVTYSLRGCDAGAEGQGAGDLGHGSGAAGRQGAPGSVDAARGGEVSSVAAARGNGRGRVDGAPVGARQAVGWNGGVEHLVYAAQQRQRQQQQEKQQQHRIDRRGGGGGGGIGTLHLPRIDLMPPGPKVVDPYGRRPLEEHSTAAEHREPQMFPSPTGATAVGQGYGSAGYVNHVAAAVPPDGSTTAHPFTASSQLQQDHPRETYQVQQVYRADGQANYVDSVGGIGGGDGDGGGGGSFNFAAFDRGVPYYPEAAYRGDSTDLQERREHVYPQQLTLQGIGVGMEPRPDAKKSEHHVARGNTTEERVANREYRPYFVPEQQQQQQQQQQQRY